MKDEDRWSPYLKFWTHPTGKASLILLLLLLGVGLVQADAPNRVALVVVHGDDEVITQCIEFSDDQITGLEVLQQSGLDLNVEVGGGMGGTVCRIDNEGCTYPGQECFCQCQSNDDCTFWSYWHLADGNWQFSGLGAGNYWVSDGDVEGWVWGPGAPGGSGESVPPAVEFAEICAALPTNTPSPSPTVTPTHPPTATPRPTEPPTPVPTPVIHNFIADRLNITAGESVQLSWNLSNAKAAYLRYNGTEEGVIAPGSKTVTPNSSTVYQLVARNQGGESISEVTITVNAAAPPPTATPAVQAAAAKPTPPPAVTPVPEPVVTFSAGAFSLPAGACTSLFWEVQHAAEIYLNEAAVDAQASQEVCPAQTQNYTLRVIYPGGERSEQITLQVAEPVVPPTHTPTPAPSAQPTPLFISTPTPEPVALAPADTAAPSPTNGHSQRAAGSEERRFTVDDPDRGAVDSPARRLLLYGGVSLILLLFVGVPVLLLVAGWVVWWLRGRNP